MKVVCAPTNFVFVIAGCTVRMSSLAMQSAGSKRLVENLALLNSHYWVFSLDFLESMNASQVLRVYVGALICVQVCFVGLHCSGNVCIPNDEARSNLGEPCTGRSIMHHMERLCKDEFYCHPRNRTCISWPTKLWKSCRNTDDCGDGLECNCKVGGIQVCEVGVIFVLFFYFLFIIIIYYYYYYFLFIIIIIYYY